MTVTRLPLSAAGMEVFCGATSTQTTVYCTHYRRSFFLVPHRILEKHTHDRRMQPPLELGGPVKILSLLKRPQRKPNGIYTRAGAQYKVYETIWNISGSLLHIWYTGRHVNFVPPDRPAAARSKSCHLRSNRASPIRNSITQT